MYLLNKAILYYLLFTLLIFSIGGIGVYYSIKHVILQQVNETLISEKEFIESQIRLSDSIQDFTSVFNHKIQVDLYNRPLKYAIRLKDSLIYDSQSKEFAEFRFLIYSNSISAKKSFVIVTSQPIEDENKLVYNIFYNTLLAFAILVIILVLVNYSISKRLWKAFYKILRRILLIDVKTDQVFEPVPSDIIEFQQLNKVLTTLNQKIRSDYSELKEYSDNASHEIQTPLSVIRSKSEQILQSPGLNDKIAESLHIINQSVTKISRINHSLMLISKIQNNQFITAETINLNKKINETLIFYNELIDLKGIKVKFHEEVNVELKFNEDLIDILLANLLSNAIKHNIEGGWIDIRLTTYELEIQNSGKEIDINPELLFQRFKKINQSSDSPGLGLSIIRKITDLYQIEINYLITKNVHSLLLKF
jgi:signal transduction histidine kinase